MTSWEGESLNWEPVELPQNDHGIINYDNIIPQTQYDNTLKETNSYSNINAPSFNNYNNHHGEYNYENLPNENFIYFQNNSMSNSNSLSSNNNQTFETSNSKYEYQDETNHNDTLHNFQNLNIHSQEFINSSLLNSSTSNENFNGNYDYAAATSEIPMCDNDVCQHDNNQIVSENFVTSIPNYSNPANFENVSTPGETKIEEDIKSINLENVEIMTSFTINNIDETSKETNYYDNLATPIDENNEAQIKGYLSDSSFARGSALPSKSSDLLPPSSQQITSSATMPSLVSIQQENKENVEDIPNKESFEPRPETPGGISIDTNTGRRRKSRYQRYFPESRENSVAPRYRSRQNSFMSNYNTDLEADHIYSHRHISHDKERGVYEHDNYSPNSQFTAKHHPDVSFSRKMRKDYSGMPLDHDKVDESISDNDSHTHDNENGSERYKTFSSSSRPIKRGNQPNQVELNKSTIEPDGRVIRNFKYNEPLSYDNNKYHASSSQRNKYGQNRDNYYLGNPNQDSHYQERDYGGESYREISNRSKYSQRYRQEFNTDTEPGYDYPPRVHASRLNAVGKQSQRYDGGNYRGDDDFYKNKNNYYYRRNDRERYKSRDKMHHDEDLYEDEISPHRYNDKRRDLLSTTIPRDPNYSRDINRNKYNVGTYEKENQLNITAPPNNEYYKSVLPPDAKSKIRKNQDLKDKIDNSDNAYNPNNINNQSYYHPTYPYPFNFTNPGASNIPNIASQQGLLNQTNNTNPTVDATSAYWQQLQNFYAPYYKMWAANYPQAQNYFPPRFNPLNNVNEALEEESSDESEDESDDTEAKKIVEVYKEPLFYNRPHTVVRFCSNGKLLVCGLSQFSQNYVTLMNESSLNGDNDNKVEQSLPLEGESKGEKTHQTNSDIIADKSLEEIFRKLPKEKPFLESSLKDNSIRIYNLETLFDDIDIFKSYPGPLMMNETYKGHITNYCSKLFTRYLKTTTHGVNDINNINNNIDKTVENNVETPVTMSPSNSRSNSLISSRTSSIQNLTIPQSVGISEGKPTVPINLFNLQNNSLKLLIEYLCLLIRQNGAVVGADISKLLMPLSNETLNKIDDLNETNTNKNKITYNQSLPNINFNDTHFRELLFCGNQKEAYEYASKCGSWGHAFCMALQMSGIGSQRQSIDNTATVINQLQNRFLGTLRLTDPTLTFHQTFGGQEASFLSQLKLISSTGKYSGNCKSIATPSVWRPHLAMLIANPNHNGRKNKKYINTLGDSLYEMGDISGAHLCYLLSGMPFENYHDTSAKLVLLTQKNDHSTSLPKFMLSDDAFRLTEIYEYTRQLSNNKDKLETSQFLSTLRLFKYIYATWLIDRGLQSIAYQYCRIIATSLLKDIPVDTEFSNISKSDQLFIIYLFDLSIRLRYTTYEGIYSLDSSTSLSSNVSPIHTHIHDMGNDKIVKSPDSFFKIAASSDNFPDWLKGLTTFRATIWKQSMSGTLGVSNRKDGEIGFDNHQTSPNQIIPNTVRDEPVTLFNSMAQEKSLPPSMIPMFKPPISNTSPSLLSPSSVQTQSFLDPLRAPLPQGNIKGNVISSFPSSQNIDNVNIINKTQQLDINPTVTQSNNPTSYSVSNINNNNLSHPHLMPSISYPVTTHQFHQRIIGNNNTLEPNAPINITNNQFQQGMSNIQQTPPFSTFNSNVHYDGSRVSSRNMITTHSAPIYNSLGGLVENVINYNTSPPPEMYGHLNTIPPAPFNPSNNQITYGYPPLQPHQQTIYGNIQNDKVAFYGHGTQHEDDYDEEEEEEDDEVDNADEMEDEAQTFDYYYNKRPPLAASNSQYSNKAGLNKSSGQVVKGASPPNTVTNANKGSNNNSSSSSGWFGGIINKILPKGPNQMNLPDDTKKAIVWNEFKKKWENSDGTTVEGEVAGPPPSDFQLYASSTLPSPIQQPPSFQPPVNYPQYQQPQLVNPSGFSNSTVPGYGMNGPMMGQVPSQNLNPVRFNNISNLTVGVRGRTPYVDVFAKTQNLPQTAGSKVANFISP